MRSDIPLLATIEIASPCPVSWATMNGSDTKRFCDSCRLHVHDLSAMTSQEAEALLQTHQGGLCVRYTQDSDGRIVTDEFPTSLRPLRALVLKHCAMAAAFVLLALTASMHQASAETKPAKAKKATTKKTTAKQNPPPILGKPAVHPPIMGTPAVRPVVNPAQKEGLTTKMGEPVARPVVETVKKTPFPVETRRFVGRVPYVKAIRKTQEQPLPQEKKKEEPKPADNPKP